MNKVIKLLPNIILALIALYLFEALAFVAYSV